MYKIIVVKEGDKNPFLQSDKFDVKIFGLMTKTPNLKKALHVILRDLEKPKETLEYYDKLNKFLIGVRLRQPENVVVEVVKEMGIDLDWSESPIVKQMYEKGLKEGLEKGRKEMLKETIFNLLEVRFENRDLTPIIKKIESINDIKKLKDIPKEILKYDSLEEFQIWLESLI